MRTISYLIAAFLILNMTCIYGQGPLFNQAQLIETNLEIYLNDQRIGDFKVEFKGDELIAIKDKNFKQILKRVVKESAFRPISHLTFPYQVTEFPYPIFYDDQRLRITIKFSYNQLRPDFYRMELDPSIKYEGRALAPAPISGNIGVIAEKGFSDQYFGGNYFSTSYDSFINVKGALLETQGYYENRIGQKNWFRGNTRLTKDFVDQRVRLQLGDTASKNLGFMRARNIGGISIFREFSINPYQRPFPQGQREFTVLSRSRVKTYVNGTLLKDEFLPAGNYNLSRLPLIDGLNFIKIEIENAFGEVTVKTFNIPTSTQILKKGISDFQISLGRSYNDSNKKRRYNGKDILSIYGQYGFSSQYTASLYSFLEKNFSLGGMIHGLSTAWGNFFYESSYSHLSGKSGFANALSWQLQNANYLGIYRLSTTLRIEDYINSYAQEYTDSLRPLDYGVQLNISYPISQFMSLSVGGGQKHYQDRSLGEKTFYNLSSNIRLRSNLSASVFATHTRDFTQGQNNSLSFFLTWNFAKSNHYVNVYHDVESQTSRVSLTRDNNNKMFNPRYNINYETSKGDNRVSGRINLPTPMADLAFKGNIARESSVARSGGRNHYQGIATMGTSLLFAIDDEVSFAVSRANSGSFALFEPSKDIKKSQIKIRSTSPYADTQTPIIGSLSLPNLVNYQYREVQIDPTYLEDGVSLKQEKFILHSGYKTGHLVKVASNGSLAVRGKLTLKGKPISYKVIKIGDAVAFTDEDGQFYLAGIKGPITKIMVQDVGEINFEYKFDDDGRGIVNLGTIDVPKD